MLGSASAAPPADAPSPVVIELFTSQGCSSCPPADALLRQLGIGDGSKVIPLAFHVDYWNGIGWTDPFSDAAWTARQEAYKQRFGDGMYTPQLVVGGRAQLNGAKPQPVLAAINAQLAQPRGTASIQLAVRADPARPALVIDVAAQSAEPPGGKLQAVVAVYENDLVTPVTRGENRGRTLRNDYVVRSLQTPFSLEPKAGAQGRKTLEVKLRREWKLQNLGVAAFLQDRGSLQIHAAAVRTLHREAKASN